ncbi:hypothetical protein VTN96DRAFT_3377 [Rasamsonia emersonii]
MAESLLESGTVSGDVGRWTVESETNTVGFGGRRGVSSFRWLINIWHMDHPHPTSIELGDTFHINKKEKEKKKIKLLSSNCGCMYCTNHKSLIVTRHKHQPSQTCAEIFWQDDFSHCDFSIFFSRSSFTIAS